MPTWVFVAMVTLMGVNLRASMGSIPPLLDDIAAELDLSSTVQALLTSMTIVFVGISAPIGQKLAARIGSEGATAAVLGILAVGLLLRLAASNLWIFLISCAVTGIGMGGVSALMPSLIAHHVPRVRGFTMGMYSTGLAVGIAVAAGIALPTEALLGGWRPALALWGVVTAITAGLWLVLVRRLRADAPLELDEDAVVDHGMPWRCTTAWWVTWLSCVCMIIGFSGMAWVVPLYLELGVPPGRAAGYLVMFQLVQLVGMLTLPWITDFMADRRPLLLLTFASAAAGVAALVIAPLSLALPAVCLYGMGAGGCFALSLILLTDVTSTQADGARLNAMVMLMAYPLGALAPLLLGFLRDVTGSFTAGYVLVLVVTIVGMTTIPVFRPSRSLTRR